MGNSSESDQLSLTSSLLLRLFSPRCFSASSVERPVQLLESLLSDILFLLQDLAFVLTPCIVPFRMILPSSNARGREPIIVHGPKDWDTEIGVPVTGAEDGVSRLSAFQPARQSANASLPSSCWQI